MECGSPFIIKAEAVDNEIFEADTGKEYNFCRTNVWNNAFSSPEISCDFELLHSDLQEIKQLIAELKDIVNEFFVLQEYR